MAAREHSVVALDTELLGHFWHEGPAWLRAVLAACDRRGVPLEPLGPELDAEPASRAPVTTWGEGGDLRTWSAPAAGGLAWRQRAAELRALGGGARPSARALRELLALQASDWAFLATSGAAANYPLRRVEGHLRGLDAALADPGIDPAVRNLAPTI